MDILTKHYVESLKAIIPQLENEVGALRARVEELESELARRKGGRPRKDGGTAYPPRVKWKVLEPAIGDPTDDKAA